MATQEATEQTKKTILQSVKDYIGDVYDESFDEQLAQSIDGYLADLNVIGAGNKISIAFGNRDATWEDFFEGDTSGGNQNFCIAYVNLRAKVEFDPPQPSSLSSMQAQAERFFWYARLEFDKP